MKGNASCPSSPAPDTLSHISNLYPLLRRELENVVSELVERLSTPNQPNLGCKALQSYLLNCGKMVRPLIFLGAWQAFHRPDDLPRGVIKIALGMELFHAFILIHDDIIDCSPQRRGKPALHKRLEQALQVSPKAAEHLALVGGDIVFSFAMEQFLDDDLPAVNARAAARYFLKVVQDTGWGEAIEIRNQERPLGDIPESEILRTYYLKTTRYTVEAPLLLGALLAGADDKAVDTLKRIAHPLGLAFQIENDLHEFELEGEAAESLCYDLQGGVKTLVLKRVYENLPTEEQLLFAKHLPQCASSVESRHYIMERIKQSHALKELRKEISTLLSNSRQELEKAAFSPEIKDTLRQILKVFESRRHHSESTHTCEKTAP